MTYLIAILIIIAVFVVYAFIKGAMSSQKTKQEKTEEEQIMNKLSAKTKSTVNSLYSNLNDNAMKNDMHRMETEGVICFIKGFGGDTSVKGFKSSDTYFAVFRDSDSGYVYSVIGWHKIGYGLPNFEVKDLSVSYNSYHPSKYVYTGVSVGGVHTGGVSDVGNYYSKEKWHTSKKQLWINYKPEYYTVDALYLSESALKLAEKDPVMKNFITNGNELVLENSKRTYSTYEMEAYRKSSNGVSIMQAQSYESVALTGEQVNAVLAFLRQIAANKTK